MSLACLGSTRSVLATLGLPPLMGVCFPRLPCSGSRLLSRERALSCVHFPGLSRSDSGFRVLHKDADSVGPAFCAFPGQSSSGSRELAGCTLPGEVRLLLRGPILSFHARWSGAPCVCSVKLDSSCDPPSKCRLSRISGSLWLETGSLFAIRLGVPSLGPSLPLPLPPCLLPAVGDGPVRCWVALLWYSLNPLFWERVGSA